MGYFKISPPWDSNEGYILQCVLGCRILHFLVVIHNSDIDMKHVLIQKDNRVVTRLLFVCVIHTTSFHVRVHVFHQSELCIISLEESIFPVKYSITALLHSCVSQFLQPPPRSKSNLNCFNPGASGQVFTDLPSLCVQIRNPGQTTDLKSWPPMRHLEIMVQYKFNLGPFFNYLQIT